VFRAPLSDHGRLLKMSLLHRVLVSSPALDPCPACRFPSLLTQNLSRATGPREALRPFTRAARLPSDVRPKEAFKRSGVARVPVRVTQRKRWRRVLSQKRRSGITTPLHSLSIERDGVAFRDVSK